MAMRHSIYAHLQHRSYKSWTHIIVTSTCKTLGPVTRPGPTVSLSPQVLDAVIEALRGPFPLRLRYGEPDAPERIVEPHGLLLGHRSYLVARQPSRGQLMLNFRMDRIRAAECLDESFAFSPGFSLGDYAAQAFGVYQDPRNMAR